MFFLALASVNLASANPVCTECRNNTSDSASKTVSVKKSFVFHEFTLKGIVQRKKPSLYSVVVLSSSVLMSGVFWKFLSSFLLVVFFPNSFSLYKDWVG